MEKVRVMNVRFTTRIAFGKDVYPLEYIGVGKEDIDRQTATTIDGCIPELVFDFENQRLEVHISRSNLVQLVPFTAIALVTVDKKEYDDTESSKKATARRIKTSPQG